MKTLRQAAFREFAVVLGLLLLTLCVSASSARAEAPEAPARPAAKPGHGVIRFIDVGAAGATGQAGAAGKEGDACRVQTAGPAGEEAVSALLARKVVIDVQDMKLGEFNKALSELGGVQIVLDRNALEAINISDESLVTVSFSSMTVGAALRHLLRQIDPTLVAVPQEGTVLITTRESAQEHLVRTVYNVRNLAAHKPRRPIIQHARAGSLPSMDHSLTSLVDLIEQVVEPSSWDTEGGAGQIKPLGPEVLVVSQTGEVQERVAALLETLCTVREGQKNKAGVSPQPRSVVTQTQREFAERVHKAMAQPVRLNFEQTPLESVVAFLSQVSGLPIFLDKTALEAIIITGESPVTIQIKNVSLRSALEIVLRNLDPTLTWYYQDETLIITTREEASNHLAHVVYPVHDLTDPDPAGGLPAIDPEVLGEIVAASVEPASWDAEGGPGAVRYTDACGALVVTQTDLIQEQVLALLDDVRKIRRMQRGARPEGKIAAQHAAKEAAVAPDLETSVVIYHLGPVGPQPLFRWPLTAAATISNHDLAELKKSIVESTGAGKWPQNTTSICCVANQLIIRQTPTVHVQIGRLLTELGALEPKAGGFGGAFGSGQQGGGFVGGQGGFGGGGGFGDPQEGFGGFGR